MRILMLLENALYPGDTRVRKEALALTAAGHEVTVVAPGLKEEKRYEMVNGVRVYRYAAPPQINNFLGYIVEYGISIVWAYIYAIYIYFRHGFDVIHAHNPPEIYVFVALLFKPLGVKFVFDHHDLSPEVYLARGGGDGNRRVYQTLLWMERVTLRWADHVIATNQSYRKIEMERGNVPAERITIVRNGPDLKRFKPVEPDAELRARAPYIIGYAGSMGIQDGIDYLIRSLACLRHDLGREDFLCVLMGGGEIQPALEALGDELNISEHLYFAGWLSGDTYVRYLSSTDICADPDPETPFNTHSTMIKMMEYMAVEKPIVAFDLVEHRFSAGDAAIYVSDNSELGFAQALSDLMDDPERRTKMGNIGRKRVEEQLAWRYSAENLLEAYEKIGGKGQGAGGK